MGHDHSRRRHRRCGPVSRRGDLAVGTAPFAGGGHIDPRRGQLLRGHRHALSAPLRVGRSVRLRLFRLAPRADAHGVHRSFVLDRARDAGRAEPGDQVGPRDRHTAGHRATDLPPARPPPRRGRPGRSALLRDSGVGGPYTGDNRGRTRRVRHDRTRWHRAAVEPRGGAAVRDRGERGARPRRGRVDVCRGAPRRPRGTPARRVRAPGRFAALPPRGRDDPQGRRAVPRGGDHLPREGGGDGPSSRSSCTT